MDNLGYLCAAYTIIFVVIFGYVLFIWRRQAALEAELQSLEARFATLGAEANPSRAGAARQGQ
ncbi:MAG TPA: CcmD family protein [Candidatus Binataceae bacterium]|nr:CcmD family protein [Candidatus Binataceae bacterium]